MEGSPAEAALAIAIAAARSVKLPCPTAEACEMALRNSCPQCMRKQKDVQRQKLIFQKLVFKLRSAPCRCIHISLSDSLCEHQGNRAWVFGQGPPVACSQQTGHTCVSLPPGNTKILYDKDSEFGITWYDSDTQGSCQNIDRNSDKGKEEEDSHCDDRLVDGIPVIML